MVPSLGPLARPDAVTLTILPLGRTLKDTHWVPGVSPSVPYMYHTCTILISVSLCLSRRLPPAKCLTISVTWPNTWLSHDQTRDCPTTKITETESTKILTVSILVSKRGEDLWRRVWDYWPWNLVFVCQVMTQSLYADSAEKIWWAEYWKWCGISADGTSPWYHGQISCLLHVSHYTNSTTWLPSTFVRQSWPPAREVHNWSMLVNAICLWIISPQRYWPFHQRHALSLTLPLSRSKCHAPCHAPNVTLPMSRPSVTLPDWDDTDKEEDK